MFKERLKLKWTGMRGRIKIEWNPGRDYKTPLAMSVLEKFKHCEALFSHPGRY
jgi:hypothetical protein